MWLGSKQQLGKIETECMQIGEHCIKFSTFAKNLGVTFDPELRMDLHVNNITRSCFFQLRQLRSIRLSLTMEATKTLVHSLVSSHLDYCNSIFYGATNTVLQRLQSVLNAAARLITNTRIFDHITPVLRDQLHWLPIRQRIIFKIATFVRNSLHGRGPTYLSRSASPFRKSGREPTFFLRHGDTSPHLEPGHVASSQEASVSPNRPCGTPCPKTLQI